MTCWATFLTGAIPVYATCDEQRALEGELAALEQRWRDAEEIARIADSLAVPRGIAARLDRLKRETLVGGRSVRHSVRSGPR